MDKVSIELKINPFSTNKTKAIFHGRNIATREYRSWKEEIAMQLLSHRAKIKEFSANFDSSKQYIYARYTFGKPSTLLFTKKGAINKRGGDTQCYIKTLQDAIFSELSRHNSAIDDAQVIEYSVRTFCLDEWKIGVFLEIREI